MADTPSTPPARSSVSADERNRRACYERCDERLAVLRKAAKLHASPRLSDARREAIESDFESLEIEERRQLKILLSWGGPSDGFVLTFDKTGQDLLDGVYFHADWFSSSNRRRRWPAPAPTSARWSRPSPGSGGTTAASGPRAC
jgi:hypothetical protein